MIRKILCLTLVSAMLAACQGTPRPTATLERREGILIDGLVQPGEWSDPALEPGAAGPVLLREDGAFLYLAVRGTGRLAANLYLYGNQELHVLHAAQSLGRAVYRRDAEGHWLLIEHASPALSGESDAAALEAHLAAHGWVANTSSMGTPLDVEFKISLDYVAVRRDLAVTRFDSRRLARWPEGAQVAPHAEELLLLGGETPRTVAFFPNGWLRLNVSEPLD